MSDEVSASGVGSLPGSDVRGATQSVRELYGEGGVPYLPELPARGPGADLVGRTAAQLVGLAVDLQPSGWRLTDGSGRDASRARSFLREDLDVLAEVYDGYTGPLKVQLCGPWTLAATLELPRGGRVAGDPGATRDIVQSLADTAVELLTSVQRLVPGASLVQQWDEPALPAVLAGRLPTASGFGRVPATDPSVVRDGLTHITEVVASHVDAQVLHCCAADVPLPLIRQVSALEPSLDVALVRTAQWDGLAELVESGRRIWAGIIPTNSTARHPRDHVEPFIEQWHRVGLETALFERLVVTPACGLAGAAPADAIRIGRLTVDAAHMLRDAVAE
ncbi:methionine synthase [Flexivirga oryzae]|uniref:Methionine synthase II (Cobalamin-independent) n=1 Tax=Flexivirga oryzae TaxID=1794944 RepID=A0A839N529_9MICO|nr:methionine synthase II (cobalamin-independent) [Flexivirga oryzae]